ncbi:hypothetical protein OXX69_008603 [Metschnikowia pulcherrima]
MIKSAVTSLKERNGSSRQAVKKYVQSNFDVKAGSFDSLFNAALRKGVETGEFSQPKGPSGPIKVAKKEKSAAPATAAAAPAKVTKKPTPKKAEPETKKAAAKKAVAKAPAKKATKPVKKAASTKAAPKKAAPKKAASKKAVTTKRVVKPVKKTTLKKAIAA